MRIVFKDKSIEIKTDNDNEQDFLRTVIDKCESIFKPTYTTEAFGMKISGRPSKNGDAVAA